MSDVKWIKLSVDIFNNRKIRQIRALPDGNSILLMWLQLMCLAGTINDNGLVYVTKDVPYTDEMLAREFDLPVTVVRMGLQVFEQFDMIEVTDDILHLNSWQQWQNTDRLQAIKDYQREYHREYRQKQKTLNAPSDDASTLRKVYVNKQIRIDKKRKDKTREESTTTAPAEQSTSKKRFVKPTLEEVQAYIKEKGYNVDAEEWLAYYESVGWMIGKKPMVNWKSAVVTWAKKPRDQKTEVRQRPGSYFVQNDTKVPTTADWLNAPQEEDEDIEPLPSFIGKKIANN